MSVTTTAGVPARKPEPAHRTALSPQSPALAWAGCITVIVGAVGTVVLASGQNRPVAISAAIMTVVWAGVRWALMDVVARHRTTLTRTDIRGAWALGALLWAVAVTPELRLLAWAVSGAVTWVALERLGATRRQAAVCVGIAWGAQAFVVIGSWLARNAIIAILAARG